MDSSLTETKIQVQEDPSELTDGDVRALDITRQQLLNLQTALNTLAQELRSQPSLPSWSALQKQNGIISSTLDRLSAQLSTHHGLLESVSVFPLPQFPQSQGHILESLLRSKLEPDVEEWVQQGEAFGRSVPPGQGPAHDDLNDLWDWVPKAAKKMSKQQCWDGDYTLAERARGLDQGFETIETGLDRDLDDPGTPNDADTDEEEGSEEVEVEEDAMEGVEDQKRTARAPAVRTQKVPPMSIYDVHRFITTGRAR